MYFCISEPVSLPSLPFSEQSPPETQQLEPTARGSEIIPFTPQISATIPFLSPSVDPLPLQSNKMTQEGNDSDSQVPTRPTRASLVDNHYLLPRYRDKHAPTKWLSQKYGLEELTYFLKCYAQVCAQYDITSQAEKCKGIIWYCTPSQAMRI